MLPRLPFTGAMVVLLLFAGLLTNSHVTQLQAELVHRFGFAPRDLVSFEWVRLVTSVFFTQGGASSWIAAILVTLFAGMAEVAWGTVPAAIAFWGAHAVAVLVTAAVALPLHLAGDELATLVYVTRDVGPSAGYLGCLGLVVYALNVRYRPWVSIVLGAGLIGALALAFVSRPVQVVDVSASLAHVVAFPTGLAAARAIQASGAGRKTVPKRERIQPPTRE